MNADEARQIEQWLREALRGLKGILREPDHQSASELTEAGEYGVALETVCAQLFEYEIPVPRTVYAKLEEIGQQMQMSERTWTVLQSLVVG